MNNRELEDLNFIHVKHIMDKGIDVLERIANGQLAPLKTSIEGENRLYSLYPTDQMVIAGKPGSGKTTKLLASFRDYLNPDINPTYEDKIVIAYNSWELSAFRNSIKLLSSAAKKTINEILDQQELIEKEQLEALKILAHEFNDVPLYINDKSTTARSWYDSNAKIAEMCKKERKTLITATDHTRLVTASNAISEEQLITGLMHMSVKLKNTHETINIILSQLNRNYEINAKMKGIVGEELPREDSIFGAESVFQTSDVVTILHRPALFNLSSFTINNTKFKVFNSNQEDDLLLSNVVKSRFGKIGVVIIKHELKYGRFRSFTENELAIKGSTTIRL
jgi:replicative DNA helicase